MELYVKLKSKINPKNYIECDMAVEFFSSHCEIFGLSIYDKEINLDNLKPGNVNRLYDALFNTRIR